MTSKHSINSPMLKSNVCYSITIKHEPGNIRKDLIVLEQYEFDTNTQNQTDLINQLKATRMNQEKYFPFGGIALNLAYLKVIY